MATHKKENSEKKKQQKHRKYKSNVPTAKSTFVTRSRSRVPVRRRRRRRQLLIIVVIYRVHGPVVRLVSPPLF